VYGYFEMPLGVLYIREGILAAARNEYEMRYLKSTACFITRAWKKSGRS
jgi:hypothetical protein